MDEDIKCIHCNKEWKEDEVKDFIEIRKDEYIVRDYFCPGCDMILNGYTKVKER